VAFKPSGSGDTLYDWVQAWCVLVLAFLVAMIWVWFDRARQRDVTVHEIVRVMVRYVLASALLSYGLIKLLSTQFPPPSFDRLVESYGQSSPMGLLWTFMGVSRPYEVAAGLLETAGGLLLLFRRTTTLGAILTAGIMTNIVLMNFCYDVPVKLYSSHLLFCACWLLSPEVRRLADIFLFNRPTAPARLARAWPNRTLAHTALALKILLLGWLLYLHVVPAWQQGRKWSEDTPKPALYGLYEVVEFSRGDPTFLGSSQDQQAGRWRYVSFNQFNVMLVRRQDGRRESYMMKPEKYASAFTIETMARGGERMIWSLTYQRPSPDELVIEGVLRGKSLTLRGRRVDETKFSLLSRGFHWVNETPPNW
jgi:uncharacterized membrane protein YphA (DoxX/SURF4 family)